MEKKEHKVMKQKSCKKLTKILSACMLTLAMLVGIASPVQAAGKATIKTVSGIKFQKAKGADKTRFSYLVGSVNTGKYIMYLKDAENGKTYLLSTKDGKKYT